MEERQATSVAQKIFTFLKWIVFSCVALIACFVAYLFIAENSDKFATYHTSLECRLTKTEPPDGYEKFRGLFPDSIVLYGLLKKDWINGTMNLRWAEPDGTSETGLVDTVHKMKIYPLSYSHTEYESGGTYSRSIDRATLVYRREYEKGQQSPVIVFRQCKEISRKVFKAKVKEFSEKTIEKQKI